MSDIDNDQTLTIWYPPAAGVQINLEDAQQVSQVLYQLNEWNATIYREIVRALETALVSEADKQGRYTIRMGATEVTVDGPDVARNQWNDVPGMLAELEAAGLPEERQAELAQPKTTWKVNHHVAAVVSKNPDYKPIIDRHLVRQPRKRRVEVKQSGFPHTPDGPPRDFDWEAE
jgi:hypothetical protein